MFSFLAELFGKHRDVRELERLLHERGLDPRVVSDAVKFSICKWIREARGPGFSAEAHGRRAQEVRAGAADLLAFCILGPEEFAKCNALELESCQDARVAAASEGGDDFDADIIMLTLHAGVAHPDIAERVEMIQR